jgi:hypothetical protein
MMKSLPMPFVAQWLISSECCVEHGYRMYGEPVDLGHSET